MWLIYIIVFISIVALALLAWKRMDYAVAIVLLYLPTYQARFQLGPYSSNMLEVLILTVIVIWLLKLLFKKVKPDFPQSKVFGHYLIAGSLFILAATISLLVTNDLRAGLGLWKAYFIEPFLFFLVLVDTIRTEKQKKLLLFILGLLTVIILIVAGLQYYGFIFSPQPWALESPRRLASVFEYPNAVGLLLAPVVTLFFGLALIDSKKQSEDNPIMQIISKFFPLAIAGCGLLAIYFAVARGAFIGIAAGVLFISFFSNKRKTVWLILALIIFAVLVLPTTRQQVLSVLQLSDTSTDVRLVLWQGTLRLLKSHPILGAGLAGFPQLYADFKEASHVELLLYPHNILLNFWVEIGILGLLAFFWLIIAFFWSNLRKLKEIIKQKEVYILRLSLVAAMITLLIYGLVEVPYFKNDLAILFWLILGLSV